MARVSHRPTATTSQIEVERTASTPGITSPLARRMPYIQDPDHKSLTLGWTIPLGLQCRCHSTSCSALSRCCSSSSVSPISLHQPSRVTRQSIQHRCRDEEPKCTSLAHVVLRSDAKLCMRHSCNKQRTQCPCQNPLVSSIALDQSGY